MRKAAGEQLDAVERRMRALPGELVELREKAARDIVAERARIQEAAETERRRLVAQAKSQAAQRVSGAERDLMAGAADHVIRAATARIRADDHRHRSGAPRRAVSCPDGGGGAGRRRGRTRMSTRASAKRYARALFDVALEESDPEQVGTGSRRVRRHGRPAR